MRKLSEKLGNLFGGKRIQRHTLEYDNFDIKNFEDVLFQSPLIAQTHKEGIANYPQFKELHQDLFNALYKYIPRKVDDVDIDYEYLLNSHIVDSVIVSPKYKELRGFTKLDKVQATIGTELLGDEVKSLLDKMRESHEQALNKMAKAIEQVEEAKKEKGTSEDGKNAGIAKAQQALSLKEAQKVLEEAMKEVQDVGKDRVTQRSIQKSIERVVNQVRQTSDMIANWGLENDPSYSKTGYQEKMKLLNELRESKKLRQIAEKAGKYRRIALSAEREKIIRGTNSVYEIKLGDDLSRAIPTERMKINHPQLKKLLYKNYFEQSLQIYEYKGKERKGKGPMVCCIDGSGSMSGIQEVWAKSVALALLDIARVQKRSMYIIHFNAEKQKSKLHTNTFLKTDPYNIREVLDMAQFFPSGGTLFQPALDLARDSIDTETDFRKSDIIFITDGSAAVSDEWAEEFNKWKKVRNIKVFSVLVDSRFNTDVVLQLFSDSISKLSTLRTDKQDDLALTIFQNM